MGYRHHLPGLSFNRTIVELKLSAMDSMRFSMTSFNRTIVELKQAVRPSY